jgi:cell division protein ZapE
LVSRSTLLQYFSGKGIELDGGQQQLAEVLDHLQQRAHQGKRNLSFFRRRPLTGAYIWGEPGRGKTLLMDGLFGHFSLPSKRIHYHLFLRDLHRGMANAGGQADYLVTLAHQVASECRMFCLDEFHLHDVADVILMERFLEVLLKQQVLVILTSNYRPQDLLPNPDVHHRAVAVIALIERHLQVLHLQGDKDYRRRGGKQQTLYWHPCGAEADQQIRHYLHNAGLALTQEAGQVTVNKRQIPVRAAADGVVWFDFEAICLGPRSHLDYLDLAQQWPLVVVSGVCRQHLLQANGLRRFIWLVDVMYEHQQRLLLTSEQPLEELLSDPALQADCLRALSRLMEMQLEAFGTTAAVRTGLLGP